MEELILTVDLGTSGPKVSLFDERAKLLGSAFEEVPLHLFDRIAAEQKPSDWISAIKRGYARLLAETQIHPKHITAINCTAQWSGTVAVDLQGEPLMNAILWMDSRGAAQIRKLNQSFPSVDGYSLFKLLKWLKITGGAPSKTGKDSLAHILYVKNERSDIYERTHKFLEPKDYLNLYFSGQFLSSYDAITLYWMTDNRDLSRVQYQDALLKMVGLDRSKLPDLVPTNTVVGPIKNDIAREWGLNPNCVLISGAGDIHSAAVGSGAVQDYEGHLYVGTSSWMVFHTPVRKTDVLHNIGTIPSALPGKYMLANEQQTMGACLQFLRNHLFYPSDVLNSGPAPFDFYSRVDQLVDTTDPGADGLAFMPWLYGERSPVDDSNVRGGWVNLSLSHSRGHLFRSVLEGVAFNSKWLLTYVEKLAGKPFTHLNFIGGGAKSETWSQIYADILERPIRVMKDPILCNSRGTALLALLALDRISVADVGHLVEVDRVFEPRAQYQSLYQKQFEQFKKLYKLNSKINKDMKWNP